jgi:tellurite resistance protein
MTSPLNPHTALVYIMILTSASDRSMRDTEMARIGELTRGWPVFEGFNQEMLVQMARDCASILSEPDGVETIVALIRASVPTRLADTAYFLACHVAAADRRFALAEMQMLELLRGALGLDRLTAAALERAAIARSRTVSDGMA